MNGSPFCLACFSEDIEVRGGGRIRSCKTCGAQAERNDKGTWRITRRGATHASFDGARLAVHATAMVPPAPKAIATPPAPKPAGQATFGALDLGLDGLKFSCGPGCERLAAEFKADFRHAWLSIPPAERASMKARWSGLGGLAIWLVKAPVISPSGQRASGLVTEYDGGLELLFSDVKLRTMGSVGVLAHELAHASGAASEVEAWALAARWLERTGTPGKHAARELEQARREV